MHKKLLLIATLLIFLLSACSAGRGGTVSGSRQSCQGLGGWISCEGGFDKLSGTFSQRVAASFYNAGDGVVVEALIAVESGRLLVSLTAPDGSQVSAEVVPGTPAVVKGLAAVESSTEENMVPLSLQALDGSVEGITYQILINQP
jgi:hypothetical protein